MQKRRRKMAPWILSKGWCCLSSPKSSKGCSLKTYMRPREGILKSQVWVAVFVVKCKRDLPL